MDGPSHYREAERLLQPRTVHSIPLGEARQAPPTMDMVLQAQVHATLALAAATARPPFEMAYDNAEERAWFGVCAVMDVAPRGGGDDA